MTIDLEQAQIAHARYRQRVEADQHQRAYHHQGPIVDEAKADRMSRRIVGYVENKAEDGQIGEKFTMSKVRDFRTLRALRYGGAVLRALDDLGEQGLAFSFSEGELSMWSPAGCTVEPPRIWIHPAETTIEEGDKNV